MLALVVVVRVWVRLVIIRKCELLLVLFVARIAEQVQLLFGGGMMWGTIFVMLVVGIFFFSTFFFPLFCFFFFLFFGLLFLKKFLFAVWWWGWMTRGCFVYCGGLPLFQQPVIFFFFFNLRGTFISEDPFPFLPSISFYNGFGI